MENENILHYLIMERENLLFRIGENMNEFNKGRVYTMDKMIDGIKGIYFTDHQTLGEMFEEVIFQPIIKN